METKSVVLSRILELDAEDAWQVCGGILEKIEPGDEFLTLADQINKHLAEHPILYNNKNWNGPWL